MNHINLGIFLKRWILGGGGQILSIDQDPNSSCAFEKQNIKNKLNQKVNQTL